MNPFSPKVSALNLARLTLFKMELERTGVGAVVTALPALTPIPRIAGTILPEGLPIPQPFFFLFRAWNPIRPPALREQGWRYVKRHSGFPNEYEVSLPDEGSRITRKGSDGIE